MKIRDRIKEFRRVPAGDLLPNPRNWRKHPKAQMEALQGVLAEIGFAGAVLARETPNGLMLIDGHLRTETAGMAEIPVLILDVDENEADKILATFDPLGAMAIADGAKLDAVLRNIQTDNQALATMLSELAVGAGIIPGDDTESGQPNKEISNETLAERFGIPPLSVMDARQGKWQNRKRAWISLGIESKQGRDVRVYGNGGSDPVTQKLVKWSNGQSVFDPVLTELIYRWFVPKNGIILDPFAGGSVRGIVAAKLERQYIGVDLSTGQIEANNEQAKTFQFNNPPVWHIGDSMQIDKICHGIEADFVFSCPPYADLEKYSDNPKDISTMKYVEFLESYRSIILKSCSMLKNNRFACFVVGEVRDKIGNYYNFVGDTVRAFIDAGLQLYNEGVLITPVASAALLAGNQFVKSRKFGKVHQNVLIFVKGDAKIATEFCGECEHGDIENMEEFGEIME
jgi:DNA modification methylase